jgi:hypothetical protein
MGLCGAIWRVVWVRSDAGLEMCLTPVMPGITGVTDGQLAQAVGLKGATPIDGPALFLVRQFCGQVARVADPQQDEQ